MITWLFSLAVASHSISFSRGGVCCLCENSVMKATRIHPVSVSYYFKYYQRRSLNIKYNSVQYKHVCYIHEKAFTAIMALKWMTLRRTKKKQNKKKDMHFIASKLVFPMGKEVLRPPYVRLEASKIKFLQAI